MMKNILHIKLSSGEEILTEIVETLDDRIVTVKSLGISSIEDDNMRYYLFRPFMLYQVDPENHITINKDHIGASGVPSEILLKQYNKWWDLSLKAGKKDSSDIAKERGLGTYYSADSDGIIRLDKNRFN